MTKPSIPKGTRDFGPKIMAKRNFIFNHIRNTFQNFGFQQLETPSMENLNTLTGKYGDEGDQLLFKILNSGEYLKKNKKERINQDDIDQGEKHILPLIAEKGLRYDLTVPFARFVAMNRNELPFPFKRFQIQPVWRADRPQKGRYREFYQCDADVVGTESLICEAEIIMMINEVFSKLGITDFAIKINNRKILSAIAELVGAKDQESDLFVAIDKLDKIGVDKVLDELRSKSFSEEAITKINSILSLPTKGTDGISPVKEILADVEAGSKGISEIEQVLDHLESFGLENNHLDFDVTLARGLSYYTGAIFEVKVNNVKIGSVSGGGRYDNLTGVFGVSDVPGIGFSFGVDRIFDVMEELGLFPADLDKSTKVLIVNFDKESEKYGLGVLRKIREQGISAEIYPEPLKMKKQFSYANKKGFKYTLSIGSEEISTGVLTLKNMESGEQFHKTIDDLFEVMKD